MGNNCCDKASKNAKDIDTNTQDIATLKASMPDGSSQSQTYVTQEDLKAQIQSLSGQIRAAQAPTVQAITSVINNDPDGQIATAITKNLGKTYVTKGLLGLDNSNDTLTFNGNMVLKCSSASGKDCLTVQGSGALASAKQWKAGGATPSPSASAWSLGSDGNLAVNTIAARGVAVTDGTYSLHNTKGTGYQNFLLQSDANGYDTTLTLGGGANTLNVQGNIATIGTSGNMTAAGNVVATKSVRSTDTLMVGGNQSNTWNPNGNITATGTASTGALTVAGSISACNTSGSITCTKGTINAPASTVSAWAVAVQDTLTLNKVPSDKDDSACPIIVPNANNAHDCVMRFGGTDWGSQQNLD